MQEISLLCKYSKTVFKKKLLISPTRASSCVKNIFRRHKRPAQELEDNNSRFLEEIGQLELQEKMDSKIDGEYRLCTQ